MSKDSKTPHPLISQVEKALENIRPYLEADGGGVRISQLTDDNEVVLELLGSCCSCPMSAMTLKTGVEEVIKRTVPGISTVRAINATHSDDLRPKLPKT